jgi:hypothetical protein
VDGLANLTAVLVYQIGPSGGTGDPPLTYLPDNNCSESQANYGECATNHKDPGSLHRATLSGSATSDKQASDGVSFGFVTFVSADDPTFTSIYGVPKLTEFKYIQSSAWLSNSASVSWKVQIPTETAGWSQPGSNPAGVLYLDVDNETNPGVGETHVTTNATAGSQALGDKLPNTVYALTFSGTVIVSGGSTAYLSDQTYSVKIPDAPTVRWVQPAGTNSYGLGWVYASADNMSYEIHRLAPYQGFDVTPIQAGARSDSALSPDLKIASTNSNTVYGLKFDSTATLNAAGVYDFYGTYASSRDLTMTVPKLPLGNWYNRSAGDLTYSWYDSEATGLLDATIYKNLGAAPTFPTNCTGKNVSSDLCQAPDYISDALYSAVLSGTATSIYDGNDDPDPITGATKGWYIFNIDATQTYGVPKVDYFRYEQPNYDQGNRARLEWGVQYWNNGAYTYPATTDLTLSVKKVIGTTTVASEEITAVTNRSGQDLYYAKDPDTIYELSLQGSIIIGDQTRTVPSVTKYVRIPGYPKLGWYQENTSNTLDVTWSYFQGPTPTAATYTVDGAVKTSGTLSVANPISGRTGVANTIKTVNSTHTATYNGTSRLDPAVVGSNDYSFTGYYHYEKTFNLVVPPEPSGTWKNTGTDLTYSWFTEGASGTVNTAEITKDGTPPPVATCNNEPVRQHLCNVGSYDPGSEYTASLQGVAVSDFGGTDDFTTSGTWFFNVESGPSGTFQAPKVVNFEYLNVNPESSNDASFSWNVKIGKLNTLPNSVSLTAKVFIEGSGGGLVQQGADYPINGAGTASAEGTMAIRDPKAPGTLYVLTLEGSVVVDGETRSIIPKTIRVKIPGYPTLTWAQPAYTNSLGITWVYDGSNGFAIPDAVTYTISGDVVRSGTRVVGTTSSTDFRDSDKTAGQLHSATFTGTSTLTAGADGTDFDGTYWTSKALNITIPPKPAGVWLNPNPTDLTFSWYTPTATGKIDAKITENGINPINKSAEVYSDSLNSPGYNAGAQYDATLSGTATSTTPSNDDATTSGEYFLTAGDPLIRPFAAPSVSWGYEQRDKDSTNSAILKWKVTSATGAHLYPAALTITVNRVDYLTSVASPSITYLGITRDDSLTALADKIPNSIYTITMNGYVNVGTPFDQTRTLPPQTMTVWIPGGPSISWIQPDYTNSLGLRWEFGASPTPDAIRYRIYEPAQLAPGFNVDTWVSGTTSSTEYSTTQKTPLASLSASFDSTSSLNVIPGVTDFPGYYFFNNNHQTYTLKVPGQPEGTWDNPDGSSLTYNWTTQPSPGVSGSLIAKVDKDGVPQGTCPDKPLNPLGSYCEIYPYNPGSFYDVTLSGTSTHSTQANDALNTKGTYYFDVLTSTYGVPVVTTLSYINVDPDHTNSAAIGWLIQYKTAADAVPTDASQVDLTFSVKTIVGGVYAASESFKVVDPTLHTYTLSKEKLPDTIYEISLVGYIMVGSQLRYVPSQTFQVNIPGAPVLEWTQTEATNSFGLKWNFPSTPTPDRVRYRIDNTSIGFSGTDSTVDYPIGGPASGSETSSSQKTPGTTITATFDATSSLSNHGDYAFPGTYYTKRDVSLTVPAQPAGVWVNKSADDVSYSWFTPKATGYLTAEVRENSTSIVVCTNVAVASETCAAGRYNESAVYDATLSGTAITTDPGTDDNNTLGFYYFPDLATSTYRVPTLSRFEYLQPNYDSSNAASLSWNVGVAGASLDSTDLNITVLKEPLPSGPQVVSQDFLHVNNANTTTALFEKEPDTDNKISLEGSDKV